MRLTEIEEYDSSFESRYCRLSEDFSWQTLSPLDEIKPSSLTFLRNKKFLNNFLKSLGEDRESIPESYLLVDKKFLATLQGTSELETLEGIFSGMGTVDSVDLAMSFLSAPFYREKHCHRNEMVDGRQMGTAQIHPSAEIAQNVFIGEGVQVDEGVTIYPGTVVMSHSRIGRGSTLYPNVSINSEVVMGPFCRIHSNTVIGSDGFGYNFHQGKHLKVWHLGGVVIGEDVEIGANSCVDRGALGDTVIGSGCKLDNAVHIAHNCKLGEGCIICGQGGLAGSASLGDYVTLAGQVGIAPGIHLGARTEVSPKAGVFSNCPPGSKLAGHPAVERREWLKTVKALRRLSQN